MEWWEECSCTQRCPWTASSRAPTMRWTGCFEYVEPSAADDEVIKTTGAMLGGRRSYDVGKRDAGKESGAPYGGAWTGPVFVLTP